MMGLRFKPIITLCGLVFFSQTLWALVVKIPNPTLMTKGFKSNTSLFITNDSEQTKAIQVSVTNRAYDLKGTEIQKKALTDFDIYPSQMIISSGEEQVVTLKYKGPQKLKSEIAYRVIVEELPIDMEKSSYNTGESKSSLKLLVKFVKSLYVTDSNKNKPKIIMTSIDTIKKNNQPKIVITLKNEGKKHHVIKKALISIKHKKSGSSTKLKLSPKEIKSYNLLANDQRQITVDWPKNFPTGPIKGKLLSVE